MLPTTSTRQSHETGGEKAFKRLLDVAVDQGVSWNKQLNWADGTKRNCFWHKEFLIMVLELKNTVGLDGNLLFKPSSITAK